MTSEIKNQSRYKRSKGKCLIEVRVKTPHQLFDARDPAPFRERDLDDDFVEYVVSSAREFSLSSPLKLVIHVVEKELGEFSREMIRDSIYGYFVYKVDLQRSELKSFIKRAQIFLLIGLVTLGLCIGVAQNISVPSPPGALGILREGVVIFGWVSIWKPIELVLFDWYPLYEKLRFYKKLIGTEIEVRFAL